VLLELTGKPGSLYHQVIETPPDLTLNPECAWDAQVRLGDGLPPSETAFLRERLRKMKKPFADYIGIDESEINELDIPIIAFAGSGGGAYTLTRGMVRHLIPILM
jgi:phospholipase A2